MKDVLKLFPHIGVTLFVLISLLDRFVFKVNDAIYVLSLIIVIVIITIGFMSNRTVKNEETK